MLKWSIIILLCFVLPFIGIPWLSYELWKTSRQKMDDDTLDDVFNAVMPISKTNFSNKEDYLRKLNDSINNFEDMWQNRRLFEAAVEEPGRLNGYLTIARDYTTLLVAKKMWKIDYYKNYCAELDKQPIHELLEEWTLKVLSEQGCREAHLTELRQRAKALEIKILKELEAGTGWKEIRDSVQNKPLDVRISNGTWTISYQKQLILLNGLDFAVKAQPNELTFSYNQYS